MYTVKECWARHEREVDYVLSMAGLAATERGCACELHVSYMWGVESPKGDQHLAKLAAWAAGGG